VKRRTARNRLVDWPVLDVGRGTDQRDTAAAATTIGVAVGFSFVSSQKKKKKKEALLVRLFGPFANENSNGTGWPERSLALAKKFLPVVARSG